MYDTHYEYNEKLMISVSGTATEPGEERTALAGLE